MYSLKNFATKNSKYLDVLSKYLSQPNCDNLFVFPGFCDAHVHFREPGFFYKETIKSGSASASRGGYTAVFTMPNLKPVPDSLENLKIQLNIIEKDASINVYPYASITKNQEGTELEIGRAHF